MQLLLQMFNKIQIIMMIMKKNVHFKYYGDFSPLMHKVAKWSDTL